MGLSEARFAINPQEFLNSDQSTVGESELSDNVLRKWHWREKAIRVRRAAFADNEDSFAVDQSSGDTTQSLPPSQHSVASWVFRLWKASLMPLALCFLSMVEY